MPSRDPLPPPLPLAPPPVVEIERRLRWRWLAVVGFVGLMLGLGAVAAMSLLAPADAVRGVPEDADARAAAALVHGRLALPTGGLRFGSALTGEADPARAFDAATPRLAAGADSLLARAAARWPLDARIAAARGHLALARHDYPAAGRFYRHAIDLSRHYPEARLGLGVTLAQRAALEADPLLARRMNLEAMGQLAAVRRDDPEYDAALYNRAHLAALVDRDAEARALAAEYLARDAESPWAERLRAAGVANH